MTDRYSTLTVALEKDIREDDAETLLTAIRQLRGVLNVKGNVVNYGAWGMETRVKHEIRAKLFEVLKND